MNTAAAARTCLDTPRHVPNRLVLTLLFLSIQIKSNKLLENARVLFSRKYVIYMYINLQTMEFPFITRFYDRFEDDFSLAKKNEASIIFEL